MRAILPFVAITTLLAGAASAAQQVPARNAFDVPQKTEGQSCLKMQLWEHTAYTPGKPDEALRCSHLLSTDTVVSVHRWDKT